MKTDKVLSFGVFQGSVEISMEDDCLFGRILNIKDVVTYEAQTPQLLEIEFRKAVMAYYKDLGKSIGANISKGKREKELIRLLDMAIELGKELNYQIDEMETLLNRKYSELAA